MVTRFIQAELLSLMEEMIKQLILINVYNKEEVNIPGGEDFGAAHGLPQVAHRSVIWVALSGQLDVERINRQTQAQNGQKHARFSLPFR